MHPIELWWLVDAKGKAQRRYGDMTEGEVEELYEENYGEWNGNT